MQQQRIESQLIQRLMQKFQYDESQAAREVLQLLISDEQHTQEYLDVFERLFNSPSNRTRQRRDVAAIARLIADSPVLASLEAKVKQECQSGLCTITIQIAKLISNICNENPHFIDNLLNNAPALIYTLLSLLNNPQTTPNDPESLGIILNFLHNISLKETILRIEKVGPCFESLLENILTDNRFSVFISKRKFQQFVSSIFKFNSNVPIVARHAFHALFRSASALNQQYKTIADSYKKISINLDNQQQLCKVTKGLVTLADQRLIAIMNFYSKAKTQMFSKFDALSFHGLLKIFVKIAIVRPVALVNRPMQNKHLINLISQTITSIKQYRQDHHLYDEQQLAKYPQIAVPTSTLPSVINQPKGDSIQAALQILEEIRQPLPLEQDSHYAPLPVQNEENSSEDHKERIKKLMQSFKRLEEITGCFSENYYRLVISTMNTLEVSFNIVNKFSQTDIQYPEKNHLALSKFLIEVMTARLERVLRIMVKLFSPEELGKGTFYNEIIANLFKLVPFYFQGTIEAETKVIEQQLEKLEDVTVESQGSELRYLMDVLDEEQVKRKIHPSLSQRVSIHSLMYEIILKFAYHLIDDSKFLQQNMNTFVYPFIKLLKEKYLNQIDASDKLTMKQIGILRLAMKIVAQFFPLVPTANFQEEIKNKQKFYKYCIMENEENSYEKGFLSLFGIILNNLTKHSTEKTQDLLDTVQNRQMVAKSIFCKIMIQRAKSCINSITHCHKSTASPIYEGSQPEVVTSYYQFITRGYEGYLKSMNNFIMQTCSDKDSFSFKQEIIGAVLDRTLQYNIVIENVFTSKEILKLRHQSSIKIKSYVDQESKRLLKWTFQNINRYLHKLPILTKRLLHFDKPDPSNPQSTPGDLVFHQQQIIHVRQFYNTICCQLNEISLALTRRNLDLQVKLSKSSKRRVLGNVSIKDQVQRLRNLVVMIGEMAKLLFDEQYLEVTYPQVTANCIYSILGLVGWIFKEKQLDKVCPAEADRLVLATLWMIDIYLKYSNRIRLQSVSRKKDNNKINRMRKAQLKEEKFVAHYPDIEQRQKPKKKKKRKVHKAETKTLIKSPSKANLFEENIQADQKNTHKISKKRKNKPQESLQKNVKAYLNTICQIISKYQKPILTNNTFSFLVHLISRHSPRSLILSPPYRFQLSLSQILPNLLNLRLSGYRVPGYHHYLCRLALQYFDQAHIKVDYELSIKRYFFQHFQAPVSLEEFLKMLQQSFKEVSVTTGLLVQITTTGVKGQQVRIPFDKDKCHEIMKQIEKNKEKKYFVQLKEGVQMHLINCRTQTSPKRKASGPNEQLKAIKVSEYIPEGDLYVIIQSIITHSIQLLFIELDRYFKFHPNGISSYQTDFTSKDSPIGYETCMQPFTIRTIIQTIHYLVRQSPSLTPFIAKFKCKKILLNEIGNQRIKNKKEVVSMILKLLGGTQSPENMPQIGFLSILIRLFSPLVVNSVSGLIFELCLDSTPLVQLGQSKGSKGHVPFASVIRLKIVQEIQNILFQPFSNKWIFRKLCLLNIITVLLNIRQMAKLLLENNFIPKLYKSFRATKAGIAEHLATEGIKCISNDHIVKLITPFYLSTLGILQQLNINFHHSKKLNKPPQSITICSILNRQAINSQMIPAESLKKYKFSTGWPFGKKNKKLFELQEGQQRDIDLQSSSSEQDEQDSFDSDNSSDMDSFDFNNRSGMDIDGQMDFDSYISLSEPNEDLLQQQWDYSNNNAQGVEDYPMGDDPILQVEQSGEDYSDDQEQQNLQESSQQAQIREYIEHQLENNQQSQSGIQLSMGMSGYQQGQMDHYMGSNVEGFRQFVLNPINEQDYYMGINSLLNFENIKSCERISKVQKRQVNLLRFYLQIILYEKRIIYNKRNIRKLSSAEIKEQQAVEQCLGIRLVFSADQHLKATQYIEYNQIYRFDHFHKDTPKFVEDLDRLFMDYTQSIIRCPHQRRRNGFIHHQPTNVIEIIPGWNIVGQRQPSQNSSESQPISLAHRQSENQNDQGSHVIVPSEEDAENAMESESSPIEEINNDEALAQLLRVSGFQMSLREFRRLDFETQQDILMNLGGRQFVQNESPRYPQIPLLPITQDMRPLEQGRILIRQHSSEMIDEQRQPPNPIEQVIAPGHQMQPENQGQIAHPQQIAHPVQQGLRVDQNYRKMSLEHCKKLSKDVMQALNKDGKNNSKFYQIEDEQLEHLLSIFYLTQKTQHGKFPYPLFETLCINTHSLQKIISSLIALLHLTPVRFSETKKHPILQFSCKEGETQIELYKKEIYVSAALKILYTLSHLTANYFIAMPFLRINNEVLSSIAEYKHQEQDRISSFEMLILLLSEKTFTESPDLISFLVPVLNNITLHHFYKNVNKIVENNEQMEEQIITAKVSSSSITLLGMLLQNDYAGDRLQQVSKIIMRLCVEEQNLRNFISYLQKLVQQLTDAALEAIESTMQSENSIKIVNLMSIFYQMVEAFKTYPTTEQHHKDVMNSLRKIVQYEKIQKLCEKGLRILFESNGSNVSTKVGDIIDCFFILHEIAAITSNRKVEDKEIQHNRIAQLGQIGLAEQFRGQNNSHQQLFLGQFNLTKLWKEAVSHPSFKIFINSSLKKKLNELHQRSRKFSILDTPIIKIASSTPHMLTFNNKYAIFKAQLKRLRGKQKHSVIPLLLHRQQVFQESFDALNLKSGEQLRGKLKIQFQGQQGEDAGGVTREWFQLLSREMFNPNYGLFKSGSGGHTYHPSPTSYFNDRDLEYFKFIGMITGKALYDGYLLDAYFTPAFYKHILNLPITYTDMQQQDYEFFKSLTWMLENSPIEDYLELDFTYDSDNLGQIQTKQLLPGGKEIAVTEENKIQYVQLIAYAKMATSIKKQLQSFLTGLHKLIPHRLLRIFNEKELEIMISGRPTIDIEDLRKNTELVNYMKNDQIILWLFEVLEQFGMEKRTAFIQFVTGSSRVPVQGFKDLRGMNGVQKFSIHRQFQEQRLPRAHTCFNQLDLPNYATKEILIEKLTYAITEGKEGFGMI